MPDAQSDRQRAASVKDDQPPLASSSSSSPAASSSSASSSPFLRLLPSSIGNKLKRQQVHARQKHEKAVLRSRDRKRRRKETAALGEEERAEKAARDAKRQRTQDNTREADETVVRADDEEVQADERLDEFASYFTAERQPKLLLTTAGRAGRRCFPFIRDLLHVFPNSFYYARKKFKIAEIAATASEKGFTDLLIVSDDKGELSGLMHVHLPLGPSACYRLSSVRLCSELKGSGLPTAHRPEVLLNNFSTRLGHRVGRMLGSLFHQQPEFRGRRVCTFHNQRDFIFFRHHRYVFAAQDRAALQELGPRFTLKLRWLQHGLFDSEQGEYEFKHRPEMDSSRRKFFL